MIRHKCSECSGPLPQHWRPLATRTCESVCPECAAKHMRKKSARRKRLAEVAGAKHNSPPA